MKITLSCSNCEYETDLEWDILNDGPEVFCPRCGRRELLCNACPLLSAGGCDMDNSTSECSFIRAYRERCKTEKAWADMANGSPEDDDEGVYEYIVTAPLGGINTFKTLKEMKDYVEDDLALACAFCDNDGHEKAFEGSFEDVRNWVHRHCSYMTITRRDLRIR